MNQTPMQNNRKVNRALYIVTVTLLFAIAVVIAITSAASRRSKAPTVPSTDDTSFATQSVKESDTTAPVTTDRQKETERVSDESESAKPSDTDAWAPDEPSEPVNAIPEKFILPVSGFLSKGHDTSIQVYSQTMNDYRVHTGIDIVCAASAPVYASASGTVSQIWDDPLMGRCIAISHSGDCYTVYKNLSEEMVEGIAEGVSVSEGQLIAAVGNTAMIEIAEEPHLHFEMTVAGESADPLEHFDSASLASLTIDASFES